MLIDIKSKIDDVEIIELLEYSIWSASGKLDDAIREYKSRTNLHLYGYETDEELVGIIGFEMSDGNDLIIRHIAVKPEYRGLGYGRGQILEVIDLMKPKRVIAETDEDAVDFYRWIGFEVESLGEKDPGVERFRCTFLA